MEKKLNKIENATLFVGAGGFCVNRNHIVINRPEPSCLVDITERAIAAGKVLVGRNIALCAMGAMEDDPEQPGQKRMATNATLINEGVIEIHMKEIVEAFKSQVKATTDDENGTYRFIKCFAMAAGRNSLVINKGIIRVFFDNDPELGTPVYGETLIAGEGSNIINEGEIHLVGNGSFNTQVRAIAVPTNNMTVINKGLIDIDMERAATVRVLATTGAGGFIANYGDISVKSPGRIMTIARFTNTHLLNAGTVNIVSRARFIENKVSFLYQSYPLACAFYEHSLPNKDLVPPIINTGTINMHLEGTEASTPHAVCFGIYSEMVGEEKQVHVFENSGTIHVSKSGPYDFLVAEMGNNVQSAKDFPYQIQIRKWKTKSRDFAKTKDLFACSSGLYDFSQAEFVNENGEPIPTSTAGLVYQKEEAAQRGDTCKVSYN